MIDIDKAQAAVRMLLEALGENPDRPGLTETPLRVAKMYAEILNGMDDDPAAHLAKTFDVDNNEVVIEKDIFFHSTCEHHLLPFFGQVHIAYMPNGKVAGLSKLARTVEVYARRLQLQEQMTAQIADALMTHLAAKGVMVIIEAEHMCLSMRGVKKPGSKTVTVVSRGRLADDPDMQRMIMGLVL